MVKQEKIKKILFCILVIFQYTSCSVFSQNSIPYGIRGSISVCEVEGKSEIYVTGEFDNIDKKEVSSFTVVFMVFNSEGEISFQGKSNLVIKVSNSVLPGTKSDFQIPLTELLTGINTLSLGIDYLYVSRIDYFDGSIWADPFGFCLY